eukprot:SAG31_NODE_2953_length_4866_cov_7.809104_8_plen_102_part_00
MQVDRVSPGSVIVNFHVLPDRNGTPIAVDTLTSALTTSVTIAGATVVAAVSEIEDPVPASPGPVAPPPPVQSGVVRVGSSKWLWCTVLMIVVVAATESSLA